MGGAVAQPVPDGRATPHGRERRGALADHGQRRVVAAGGELLPGGDGLDDGRAQPLAGGVEGAAVPARGGGREGGDDEGRRPEPDGERGQRRRDREPRDDEHDRHDDRGHQQRRAAADQAVEADLDVVDGTREQLPAAPGDGPGHPVDEARDEGPAPAGDPGERTVVHREPFEVAQQGAQDRRGAHQDDRDREREHRRPGVGPHDQPRRDRGEQEPREDRPGAQGDRGRRRAPPGSGRCRPHRGAPGRRGERRGRGARPGERDDPVRGGQRGRPVGDDEDGGAPVGGRAQQGQHPGLGVGVEVGGGLVEQHRRVRGVLEREQHAGQRQPLALPGGDRAALVGERVVGIEGEVDGAQHGAQPVPGHRGVGQGRGHRAGVRQGRALREQEQRVPDGDGAGVGAHGAGEHPQQRRLARAGLPRERDELAGRHVEPVQDERVAAAAGVADAEAEGASAM